MIVSQQTETQQERFVEVLDMRNGVPTVMKLGFIGPNYWFIHRLMEYHPAENGQNAFLIAEYTYSGKEYWAKDHFPGNPIMPGNLQLEAGDQATVILGMLDERLEGRKFALGSKSQVKYRGMVLPEQILVIRSEILQVDDRGGRAKYETWVKDTTPKVKAVSVSEMLFFAPKSAEKAKAAGLTS